jgi:NIMA (never in mitosis gene a)-related kinase
MQNYKVVKELGSGAFGTVVLVQERASGQHYCIKKVDVAHMSQRERQAATMEAEILRRLDHPNIIQYKEQFVEGGKQLCIVMEVANDGDLDARLRRQRGRRLPEATVISWFSQICAAMGHVHGQKILHRDIKAQNIFLTDGGKVIKVGDFGISRVLRNTMEMAKTKVGTPYYLSPEICQGKAYDHKSDVWSLGCLLYELITLKHPFNASNLAALINKIVAGRYKPLPSSASPCIRQLISSMLQLDPSKRPAISEVLSRLSLLQRRQSPGARDESPRAPAAVVAGEKMAQRPARHGLEREQAAAQKVCQHAGVIKPSTPSTPDHAPRRAVDNHMPVKKLQVRCADKPRTPKQVAPRVWPNPPGPVDPAAARPRQRPITRQGWNKHYVPRRTDGCLGERRVERGGCPAAQRQQQRRRERRGAGNSSPTPDSDGDGDGDSEDEHAYIARQKKLQRRQKQKRQAAQQPRVDKHDFFLWRINRQQ